MWLAYIWISQAKQRLIGSQISRSLWSVQLTQGEIVTARLVTPFSDTHIHGSRCFLKTMFQVLWQRVKSYKLITKFSTKKCPLKQFAQQTTKAAVSTFIFPPYIVVLSQHKLANLTHHLSKNSQSWKFKPGNRCFRQRYQIEHKIWFKTWHGQEPEVNKMDDIPLWQV